MHTQSLAVSQADNARTAEALHHTLLIQMRRAVAFLATVAPLLPRESEFHRDRHKFCAFTR